MVGFLTNVQLLYPLLSVPLVIARGKAIDIGSKRGYTPCLRDCGLTAIPGERVPGYTLPADKGRGH
jgi:hypothetical protein